jgi:hypothetical protein
MKDKAVHPEMQWLVCERLRKLGYRSASTIRLYGEELHLISDPVPHENGFVVEGSVLNSMIVKRVRLPLSVVRMIEREVSLRQEAALAA